MSRIEVTVRCYGAVRERVGERSVTLSVREGASVADALAALAERSPGFDPDDDLFVLRDGEHLSVEERRTSELVEATTLSVSDPVGRE